jgi:transcriptional regulator with XRE-family HTH domain
MNPMATKKKLTKRPINARKHLEKLTGAPLTFGGMINATRLSEGVSLEAFARQLGVSRAYLCDVEKGRRAVSVERAAAWARKLGYLQAQYVALALQAEVTAAGLKLRVSVEAA